MNIDSEFKTFEELFIEICWSYESKYPITKDKMWEYINEDRTGDQHEVTYFNINKLTITPKYIEYKGSYTRITPQMFAKVEQLYDLIYLEVPTVGEIVEMINQPKGSLAQYLVGDDQPTRRIAEAILNRDKDLK